MNHTRAAFLVAVVLASPLHAQRTLKGPDTTRTELPQDLPEQKAIRAYMATLTEKDFTHGIDKPIAARPGPQDNDVLYREYLFTLLSQPLVGTKRGTPAVNAPAKLFLLSSIETPKGVMVPPVWPETLMSFVEWKHAGNPYSDNRSLKLRAFVTASIMLLMLDDQIDNNPERGGSRADWLSYQLVVLGSPYPGFKETLPKDVQRAYETLLRRMGRRVLDWGPKGEEPNMDVISVVGLWYVSKALNDPAFTKEVEQHSRKLFTDPKYFHPAGFFLDNRGIDVGYQGTTNYFTIWAALASDWAFAKENVERCHRLRAHLVLPEPDGKYVGPTHFNTRTSSDAWADQWGWGGFRDRAAALVTDEAAFMARLPKPEELKLSPETRAAAFRQHLHENPVSPKGGFIKNDEIVAHKWTWRLWHSFNFPNSLNYAHDHYPKGAYDRAAKLEKDNSPWLKSPYLRDESFLRDFASAFTVGKFPTYAAVVHSGPVGYPAPEEGHYKFAGPLGFGGGQLSAFWTPTTGSVILGRRGGNSWQKAFDLVEEWRTWPIHAVSGSKPDGKVFTTGRIVQPDVTSDVKKDVGTVKTAGIIPPEQLGQGKVLEGRIGYSRTFKIDVDKVRVETSVKAHGQDKLAELYETIPIFLHDAGLQPNAAPTKIEFEVDGKWLPAGVEPRENVKAVRLTRFTGAVRITFDKPQRIKLSPTDWKDTYLSRAVCRNLMIDLLDGKGAPVVLRGEKTVSWEVAASKEQ